MRTFRLAIIGTCVCMALAAQTRTDATAETKPTAEIVTRDGSTALRMTRSKVIRQATTAAAPSQRSASDPSLTNYEVGKSFTVAAGQTVRVQSISDWTGGTDVAISLNCAVVTNLRVYALWSLPGADLYSGTDILAGTNFAFTNQGGGLVPVHGTDLMIQVRNTGTTDVVCDQIMVYGVLR